MSGWDPDLQRDLHPDVTFAANNPDAIQKADIIFSVNYASESMAVARELLPHLQAGQFYCEMNTSAPGTKREIEQLLAPTGAHVIDMAIMEPVPPRGIDVPFLLSGAKAEDVVDLLSPFRLNISIIGTTVGEAASRKLLRSIIYKGVAAVICEAVEAGVHFDLDAYVRSQILSILSSSDGVIDRFVEGSHQHAERRMHEMEAVADMLSQEGLSALMTTATVHNLQRYVGE